MAIRVRDVEVDEERERRKQIALEALRSTGAKRVFAEEAPGGSAPSPPAPVARKASVARPEAAGKAGFDRNAYHKAYMKTYMRGWRARRKGASAGG